MITPLVDVDGILVKLECVHRTGSIKDRIAEYILTRSRELGVLAPGQRIVEATSGNTGIALAYFGARMGHPVTIVMPENMTDERKERIRSLGADLILCSTEGSFAEAAVIRDKLALENGWFNPDQFSNPLNVECHRETTGRELLLQTGDEPLDVFVAGVGTGGTLIGVGEALRERWPKVRIVAVEPEESPVMSGGSSGTHSIFGIGDGFVPAIASDGADGLNPLIDEVISVSSDEALGAAQILRRRHGRCVGISSGANFIAAKVFASRYRTVVTVFPDGFGKYASCGLMASRPGECSFEAMCLNRELELGVR